MALQRLTGQGLWFPPNPFGTIGGGTFAASDVALLDAGGEEYQIIGAVSLEGGGSATFGTSGSSLSWLPGGTIGFASGSSLRLGLKTAISTTLGPPTRATYGSAAFAVYKELTGGTDTITSITARTDLMTSGTPFTVTDGDLIAICFYLDSSSGTPSIKIRQSSQTSVGGLPAHTLITASGATLVAQQLVANVVITFDDGSTGWIDQTVSFSASQTNSATIGINNIKGNIFRLPFPCSLKSISAILAIAGDFSLDLYSSPLGTPFKEGEILCDANITATASGRLYSRRFATAINLAANTDYAIGVRQTTATAQTIIQNDVAHVDHWQPWGLGPECYAADSVAGGTFTQVASGLRRYSLYAMIIHLDDGIQSGKAQYLSGF